MPFRTVWNSVRKAPFLAVFVLAVGLQLIGEQFPFSPFPMYSGFSKETSVIYVTNRKNQVLPVKKFFLSDASKVKKTYVQALAKICKKAGYSESAATSADLQAAGAYVTTKFLPSQVRGDLPSLRKNGLRLYRMTLKMSDGGGISESTELVGEWGP